MNEKPPTLTWQFSNNQFTGLVEIQDGIIVRCAPVFKAFVGQPAANLQSWLARKGGFRKFEIGVSYGSAKKPLKRPGIKTTKGKGSKLAKNPKGKTNRGRH